MHFVMMMKEVKEGMDTAQTGGVVKDPQVEGDLLVLTAEDGRGVALTMAQMVVAEVTRGAAPTMTTSAVKLALVASAVKPALVASAVKPVLAMTGPPGMFGVIVILLRLKSIMLRHHAESPVCIV
jgi:hypothetical protein